MRIIIDMQGAQTKNSLCSYRRNIMTLVKAIVRNRRNHEIILALNGLFSDTIEPIRAYFDELLSQENIKVWHAHGPIKECDPKNHWRHKVAEYTREAFIKSLEPDIVHIMSHFDGYLYDCVSSIGVYSDAIPTIVNLNDYSPLIKAGMNSDNSKSFNYFLKRRMEYLKHADTLVVDSKASAETVIESLGANAQKVICIPNSSDDTYKQIFYDNEEKNSFLKKIGISDRFVFCYVDKSFFDNVELFFKAYVKLPNEIRNNHQLLLAGCMPTNIQKSLKKSANTCGLKDTELILIKSLHEIELCRLYNLCAAFVFLSNIEGFTLPVLEAMSCGSAVIVPNYNTVKTIIGREDVLFNPLEATSITEILLKVLEEDTFREELQEFGLKQSKRFSSDKSASLIIENYEKCVKRQKKPQTEIVLKNHKPKLAYVSPLPPERSGIADYSAELLPELINFYDIEVVVNQQNITDKWILKNCKVRDTDWLIKNGAEYDRVIYHFGNSPFHSHMLDLIKEVPGVVILHDFFLSSMFAYKEDVMKDSAFCWTYELYRAHGYSAVEKRWSPGNYEMTANIYPVNASVIEHSTGIIVHSEFSKKLGNKFYGEGTADHWCVIPLLRTPAKNLSRKDSKESLGLKNKFVVCSVGLLGKTKLNHRLLNAWIKSKLSKEQDVILVFIGEKPDDDYGKKIDLIIRENQLSKRVIITGWTELNVFRNFINAADLAVQLRSTSRGETSAAVLDCMNYGIPTIVNANGSFGEIPKNLVYMLQDDFEDDELIAALEKLYDDRKFRIMLGQKGKSRILKHHTPGYCAKKYTETIEGYYKYSKFDNKKLLAENIARIIPKKTTYKEIADISKSVSRTISPKKIKKHQILLDITATHTVDLKTGIERVAKSITKALINYETDVWKAEPVYLKKINGEWCHMYARKYTLEMLNCPKECFDDEIIDVYSGDILIMLDLSGDIAIQASKSGLFSYYRNLGVKVYSVVFDILPIQLPHYFPVKTNLHHLEWLKMVIELNGCICISDSIAKDMKNLILQKKPKLNSSFLMDSFFLGANFKCSSPVNKFRKDENDFIKQINFGNTFLMVGTIEPRKGHLQAIKAFDLLWQKEYNYNLVIVGREGWKDLPKELKRTIPEITERLRQHKKLNKNLFWLDNASDELLESVYLAADCLLFPSEGEGFGLPLIEAAQHKLPIIARDIPVFREIAGDHVFYFAGKQPDELANAINEWVELFKKNKHPKSENIPWISWEESAKNLFEKLINDNWKYKIKSDGYMIPGFIENHISWKLEWVKGWSFPEDEIRWSESDEAIIRFRLSEEDYLKCETIRLRFAVFEQQHIRIILNNGHLFEGLLYGDNEQLLLQTNLFLLGQNQIRFDLPDAKMPGVNDTRKLAIAFKEIEIS